MFQADTSFEKVVQIDLILVVLSKPTQIVRRFFFFENLNFQAQFAMYGDQRIRRPESPRRFSRNSVRWFIFCKNMPAKTIIFRFCKEIQSFFDQMCFIFQI